MNLDLSPFSRNGAVFNVVMSGLLALFGLGLGVSGEAWGWGLFFTGLGFVTLFTAVLFWVLRRDQ